MTPTPTASDHIERNSTSTEAVNPLTGKSVTLDRFVRFWPDNETQKSGQPKMWPTPTAAAAAGEGQFLETLVDKDGNPPKRGQRVYNPATGNHAQVTLNRAVKLWPTPTESEGKPHSSGSLNPAWVEWLMGYPSGWTDLED